jgi:hypothetical protein
VDARLKNSGRSYTNAWRRSQPGSRRWNAVATRNGRDDGAVSSLGRRAREFRPSRIATLLARLLGLLLAGEGDSAGCNASYVSRALFIFDQDNWCSVFRGPEQAAANLEAADVEANEYVAFDECGRVFRLWAAGLDVHVAATPDRDEGQLRARLRRFLDEWRVEAATDDLIEIGNAILRDDWNRRWPRHPRWLARRLNGTTPPTL